MFLIVYFIKVLKHFRNFIVISIQFPLVDSCYSDGVVIDKKIYTEKTILKNEGQTFVKSRSVNGGRIVSVWLC